MDLSQANQTFSGDYADQLTNLQNQDLQQRQFIADRKLRQQQDTMAGDMSMPTAVTSLPDAAPTNSNDGAASAGGDASGTSPISTSGRVTFAGPNSPVNGTPAQEADPSQGFSGRSGTGGFQGDQKVMAPNPKGAWAGRTDQPSTMDQLREEQQRNDAYRSYAAHQGTTDTLPAGQDPIPNIQDVIKQSDAKLAALKQTAKGGSTAMTSKTAQANPANVDASGKPVVAGAPADAPTKYDPIIQSAAQSAGIDPTILKRLIGSESSFNPTAVSPRGAQYGYGIAQIAASHGLSKQQMEDPNIAIPFAANLLKQYADQHGGDMGAALLAYKGASSSSGIASMQPIVAKILNGLAPGGNAQAATVPQAPAAAAPTGPQGPGQTYAPGQGSDYNFDQQGALQQFTQLQQAFKLAQFKAQNAATGAERDAAMGQMQQYQQAGQQLHGQIFSNAMLQGVRSVEAGNMGALGQMVQAMAQNTGTPLVIHPTGQGQYGLFTPDGKPVSPPGAPADLAHYLYGKTAPAGRALLMQNASAFNQAYQPAAGKAAGEAPSAQALEALKGQNEVQKALATGQMDVLLQQWKMKGVDIKPDPVSGGMYAFTPDGKTFAYIPPSVPGSNTIGLQMKTGVLPGQLPK